MKKSELKKILKPLVQECIKESLLEDGLISGIIAEVVRGMGTPQPIVEAVAAPVDPMRERMQRNAFTREQSIKLKEHKNKLMSAIGDRGFNGVNLFEGTTPGASEGSSQEQAGPMSGQEPADPGVDITGLLGAVGNSWNAHMTDVKEGK